MSESETNLTAAQCQARIDQFIEVTKTDEALAQSVLQDHDWNLEPALNAYLASETSVQQGVAAALLASNSVPEGAIVRLVF